MISIALRTTVMFFLVIFTMRLMGKKSLGEFQPSDLVSVMLISNLTSIVIEAPELPILYSAVPILLITCYEVFMSVAVRKSNFVSKLARGETKILIKNGVINQQTMKDLRFTINDILEGMREKNIFYLEEVKLALVETTGAISIYPDPDAERNIAKAPLPPFPLITDGIIHTGWIKEAGIEYDTVYEIIKQEKTETDKVLLLLVDSNNQYNITLKEEL